MTAAVGPRERAIDVIARQVESASGYVQRRRPAALAVAVLDALIESGLVVLVDEPGRMFASHVDEEANGR